MKLKKENGLVGTDIVMAIVAVMIFSSLIFAMIFNNAVENVKLKKETMAMIYITEFFENIGIASYNEVTQENILKLLPREARDKYNVVVQVIDPVLDITDKKDIMKNVTFTLSYNVNGVEYSCTMQRIKIKE